ncbi:helix-turn-helix domain-containing protein [Enterococcus lactis]|uniref:helix-turn-helix domain-containing protein n=1 Tax=Enterococcus lactis TaxID=357441 RepID=UPI003D98F088
MPLLSRGAIAAFFGLGDVEEYDSTETYKDFGSLLREIRQTAGMTTPVLAEKSGISQSYISQLENNVRLPSDKIIKRIAYALTERNNKNSNVEKFYFSSVQNEKKCEKLVIELTRARDFMKVKDIPSLVANVENEHTKIFIDESSAKFLDLFNQIDKQDRQNLFSYMEFLINKK